ncbi:DUF6868 family protein [Acinetobacter sp.]|uniref:DUF6868 family protein n=1 Tax=Acinetobacter sp. TaxID=472 RepID=UPI0035B49FC5
MNITQLADFLLYRMLFNYAILIIWFLAFVFAKGWMKSLHGRWFKLSDDSFDAIHYGSMAAYKIGILLLNLAPYIALKLL